MSHRLLFIIITFISIFSVAQQKTAEKIVLRHADKVQFDDYALPGVQIFTGNVSFFHNGLLLDCDSANFFQDSNSFEAFGKVKMRQGDTLSLNSKYLYYDGNTQVAQARHNVVLKHHKSILYTDSLNYDRIYGIGYFFEGGKLIDNGSTLTSDWGQYETATRMALFTYNVQLHNEDYVVTSDTLYYNTITKDANMVGPSNVISGESNIYTENGFFNTFSKKATLLDRSIIVNKNQQIIGDSVIYNKQQGYAEAFNNVYFNDKDNKNIILGDYCYYNDSTGYSLAYGRAEVKSYSEPDTLFLHADTFKIHTYNLRTDSVYRILEGYYHSRSYRTDIQSVADTLSYNSLTKKLSLYGNPIIWNDNRQVLGEEIHAYFNDSTMDSIYIVRQALMAERLDTLHFNQVASKEMHIYFQNGEVSENHAIDNVLVNYFPYDSDSLMIGMNYTETSQLKLFMENRKTSKIWTKEATGTFYPLPFVGKDKLYLNNFAWFDYIRPLNKDDIFEWRGKKAGTELKAQIRHQIPLQHLKDIK